jgi:predicted chitinase
MRASEFQESISRRDFLGGAGAAIGLGTLGYGAMQQKKRSMSDPYGDTTSDQNEPAVSATQSAKKLTPASPAKPQRVIPKYTPAQLEQYLIDYASKHLPTSQLIQFMAQAKTETHDFRSLAEYDSLAHSKYSGGQKYKGRGYLQITHDHNYEKYGQMIGQDLVNDPDLLLYPNIAAQASLAYWEDYAWPTSQRLMKKFKNQFRTVTKAVTKAVNGGYKKLDEREKNVRYYTNKFAKPGDGRVVTKKVK